MKDVRPPNDPKQKAILTAAFEVLSQYGYRRTSMEDIARAAGVSRPALYQYFRNKEDLAQHFVSGYYESVGQEVEQALAGEGSVADLLERGFRAKLGPYFEHVLDSPHGMELIEIGHTVSADIAAKGNAQLQDAFAAWLDREVAAGRVVLAGTSQDVAATLLGALMGIKSPPYAEFERQMVMLAHMFGRALQA